MRKWQAFLLGISIMCVLGAHTISDNTLKLGDGTDSDKEISAQTTDADKPAIRWDESESYWAVSHDGVNFSQMAGRDLFDQGELKFYESDGSGTDYISFKAPSSVTTTTDFTLPDGDGAAGEVLGTNGSKELDWYAVLTNPMDARGDLITRNAGGATVKLALGTANYFLSSDGSDPVWSQISSQSSFTAGAKADEDGFGVVSTYYPDLSEGRTDTLVQADYSGSGPYTYTIPDADEYDIYLIDDTDDDDEYIITLPDCTGNVGREITFIKIDSTDFDTGTANRGLVIDGAGGETVGGRTTQRMYLDGAQMTVYCYGSNAWKVTRLMETGIITVYMRGLGTNPSSSANFDRNMNSNSLSLLSDLLQSSTSTTVYLSVDQDGERWPVGWQPIGGDVHTSAVRTREDATSTFGYLVFDNCAQYSTCNNSLAKNAQGQAWVGSDVTKGFRRSVIHWVTDQVLN